MDSWKRFDETLLPDKNGRDFYSNNGRFLQ